MSLNDTKIPGSQTEACNALVTGGGGGGGGGEKLSEWLGCCDLERRMVRRSVVEGK